MFGSQTTTFGASKPLFGAAVTAAPAATGPSEDVAVSEGRRRGGDKGLDCRCAIPLMTRSLLSDGLPSVIPLYSLLV